MWRLSRIRHKAGRAGYSLEEFRVKRREHEKALRQARRDRQLVSRRLLLNEDEGQQEAIICPLCAGCSQFVPQSSAQRSREGISRGGSLLFFWMQENSIHMLVGLLTGPNTQCRLQSVRCLHELSHSPHPSVATACLPATPYLLTYLSGQKPFSFITCLLYRGTKFTVTNTLIEHHKNVPETINCNYNACVQNQRHNMAVMEAVGFTLSQLLQTKDASEKIIPLVLASSLPSHLLAVLTPDQNFALGPAIECAWCLHYLTCSGEDNRALLACGALLQCSMLLVSLGGAVAQGNKAEGVELLVCPLLRCVGNLLSCTPDVPDACLSDVGLTVALCALLQAYVQTQPSLARESAWLNLKLFFFSIVTSYILTMLGFISPPSRIQILRVLANVAHKKKEFCIQLAEFGLLSSLCATLKMAEQAVVTLSLDILFMLFASGSQVSQTLHFDPLSSNHLHFSSELPYILPQVVEDFAREGGISLLETFQYYSEEDVRRKAVYLLEGHVLSSSSQCAVNTPLLFIKCLLSRNLKLKQCCVLQVSCIPSS
uniref:Transmembrane and coiled-coil domains 6 n=1 Tax=Hippocampus comes TaxID=109280 RepID=A0A3Q2Y6W0_HIPCM